MRLIDADKLEDFISGPFAQSYKEARDAVRKAPTVEAVPLEPLCQWLAGYAAPPNYAMKAVYDRDILNGPFERYEAWKYHFRELLKIGLMDTEE